MKLGTRNENLGIRMSAKFFLLLMISALFAFGLVSCADEDGLHDQNALMVTFEFTGFGDISGSYAIPGNFDDWDKLRENLSADFKFVTFSSNTVSEQPISDIFLTLYHFPQRISLSIHTLT